jgi:protein-disulfide isomerase
MLFRWLVVGLVAVGLLGGGRAASADQFTPAQRAEIVRILRDALKSDPSILRDAVAALQADDAAEQRKAVLAHEDALIRPDDPVGGNPHGSVTIVEFFDVRCPYCRTLEPQMAALLRGDPGVRVVYKDLPILGPGSILGSRALLAAQKQGGYEKLRSLLMQGSPDVTEASVRAAVGQAGLDWTRLQQDMNDPAVQQRLTDNMKLAREIGIEGTPALVVGGDLLPGAVDLAELKQAVAKERGRD